jgi:hypothetical protein
MALSLFRSTTDPGVYCLTADATADNLPYEFGPWRRCSDEALKGDGTLAGLASSHAVGEVVARDGYYLSRALPVISPWCGANW